MIVTNETALNFSPFLLSVKHRTVEEASGVDPSVATNPSGGYRWVLTNHSVCGYCLVLFPFLNTRTPWKLRTGNDIVESFSIHKLSKAYAPVTEKDSFAKTNIR